MVTRDSYAKVLDFGLAKLVERKPSLVADDLTREGCITGTLAYMSPEQTPAQPLDARSDIFSFGCILYEAATRRRPFVADSDVDLMHKIMHDKPEPIDRINPAVPSELRRIVRRCLAKEREQRYQSMKDLAIELHELHTDYDQLPAPRDSSPSDERPTVIMRPVAPRKRWLAIAEHCARCHHCSGWRRRFLAIHKCHASRPTHAAHEADEQRERRELGDLTGRPVTSFTMLGEMASTACG